MSHTAAAEYEILGFSLLGPPPVGSVYVPWEVGLTVLYGANGAGKTATLRGLESAMTGIAIPGATSMMHIRAHPRFAPRPPRTARQVLRELIDDGELRSPKPSSSGLIAAILDAVEKQVVQHVRIRPGYPEDDPFDSDVDLVHEYQDRLSGDPVDKVSALVEAFCGNLPNASDIATEVSRQLSFTLTAAGTAEHPSWNVEVSVVRSSETPVANAVASNVIKHEGWWELDDGRVFLLWIHPRSQDILSLPGAPMSIVQAGTVEVKPVAAGSVAATALSDHPQLIRELRGQDVDAVTTHALESSLGLFDDNDDNGWTLTVKNEVPEILGAIERAANQVLDRLLLDAPELSASIADPPTEWLAKPVIYWQARDRYASDWVPISQLSEAQRRWSEVAIQIALATRFRADQPTAVIIDEPEQALHRLAISRAVDGLVELGSARVGPIVVASHSAEFLDARNARLVHVKRLPDGSADARVMDPATGESVFEVLESTGGLADVLLGTRVWLIVEGQHDKVVVETLLGDDLERFMTKTVPVGGTPNLSSVIDSRLLFDFSDAVTVIALDRTSHPRLFKLWATAQEMCERGDHGNARHHANKANTRGFTKEERYAYQLLLHAIHEERLDRVHLFGFEKPDILYYLPVSEFVSDATSWEELTRQRRRKKDGSMENVKGVIKRRSGKPVNVTRVKNAMKAMDDMPQEFTELLNLCRRVSGLTKG